MIRTLAVALIALSTASCSVVVGGSYSPEHKAHVWVKLIQCMPWDNEFGTIICSGI